MNEIYIIFDGPPSHEYGRFVEVEDGNGKGLGTEQTGAEWKQRKDGLWQLGPFANVEVAFGNGYSDGLDDGRLEIPCNCRECRCRSKNTPPSNPFKDGMCNPCLTGSHEKAEAPTKERVR